MGNRDGNKGTSHGAGSKRGIKGGIKGKLLVLILCCAAVLMAGFRGEGEKESQSELGKSLPLLASLGKSVTVPGSPLRLVLKWQGEYNGDGPEAGAAATDLSAALGLGEASRDDGEEHLTYRSAASGAGFQTTMFWSELGDGRSYVIVTLETPDLLNAPDLQAAAEEAGTKLRKAGVKAEWNTSLQGTAKEEGDPREALLLTEQTMNGQLAELSVLETYEDETTASHSYNTPALQRSVMSGNHKIALQAAIHKDVKKGSSRVTIGFPLITIEY
ncbi:YwmB family TATA-box binding protein [Paenibacillus sp. BR2-3]|uniref:YwmB family TATA-box binding protein n=1 Tax=Paenibacillus sp. BR2-3 TaxID=3048494 RepID=UPI003977A908